MLQSASNLNGTTPSPVFLFSFLCFVVVLTQPRLLLCSQAYHVYHSDETDGWSVNTTIPIQQDRGEYKTYNIIYVVFEKAWSCAQYPPDNAVTFYDIKVQYDGQTVAPQWTTSYVDDVCNNRAHVVNSTTIQITWDSEAEK
eukprot:m.21088 g.21088  ORF g.21088 m.21088 type:complete len:141 (-) comp6330_c0_seq2:119-541(-)